MASLSQTTQAVAIVGKGGPEVLTLQDIAVAEAGPGQVLIKVAAAGVNRPDIMQRQGVYPAPKGHSAIPGLEVAGHVAALGPGVNNFKIGDAVMALVNGGGYAGLTIAEEVATLAIPAGMSMIEAAAIPETFFTVWHNVFERGALKNGEWFLVHGGTSGIGVTAIQLAKAFGARVIATAGSPSKCEACRALGADIAIDYTAQDFADVIKTTTEGRGVDVILDMVGGDYIERNIKCLADDGRLVNIAYQKGSSAQIDFMRVMLKRLTITGSTLRVRTNAVKGGIAQAVAKNAFPLISTGKVKVLIDSTFPLRDAAAAHARMESSQHIGKIVLTVA